MMKSIVKEQEDKAMTLKEIDTPGSLFEDTTQKKVNSSDLCRTFDEIVYQNEELRPTGTKHGATEELYSISACYRPQK